MQSKICAITWWALGKHGRRRNLFLRGLGICLFAAVFSVGEAQANTAQGPLAVSMQITASCSVGTSALTFTSTSGTALTSAQVTQTGSISVTCTNSSPYSVGLDNGSNASSGQRRMINSTSYIPYNLYTDSAHQNPWTTSATSTTCTTANGCSNGTGNGSAQTINVYGVVPTVTVAPASGSYSDTVTITVTY